MRSLNRELERNGFPWEGQEIDLFAQIPRDAVKWFMAGSDEGIKREPDTVLLRVARVYPPLARRRGKLLIRDVLIERELQV